MKKFISVVAGSIFFGTVSAGMLSTVSAQETPTVNEPRQIISTISCNANKQKVFDIVRGKHGEQILAHGNLLIREATKGLFHKAQMIMTLNPETGSWSIIGIFPDGTGCLVSSGDTFIPYATPKEQL